MKSRELRALGVALTALLVVGLSAACSSSNGSANSANANATSGSSASAATSNASPASAPSSSGAGTASHPLAGTTIKVGVAAGPPFMFQDAKGNWTSFSYELIEKFGEWEGAKMVLVPSSFPTFIAGLQAGKYDMIQPINQTPEREKVANFSLPVSGGGTTAFVNAGSKYKTLDDLNNSNVTIAVISGSADESVAKKLLPKATFRSLPTATVADLATEVVSGRSDAMVDSTYLAPAVEPKFNLRSIPDYATNPQGLSPVNISFPVSKGSADLLNELNSFIKQETDNGGIQKLTKQWLTLENDLKG